MSKIFTGIIDVLLPGLIGGTGGAISGNPFEAPWGDGEPAPVTDAGDGGEVPRWVPPYNPANRANRSVPESKSPDVITVPETWEDGAARRAEESRARSSRAAASRKAKMDEDVRKNNEWRRNRDLQQAGSIEEKEQDFLSRRRANEQKWQESRVPPGVLLPIEDDWAAEQPPPEGPNWARRAGLAGIAAVGSREVWKNRIKWGLKNSGTMQQRQQFPPSPGLPGDLVPPADDLPVFPSKPSPQPPNEASGWIRPHSDQERVRVLQETVPMDCSC